MSMYFLDERSSAKFQEMVRWFDANVGGIVEAGTSDPLAGNLVPFEITAKPEQNDDGVWFAKGKQLYFKAENGYEINAAVNDHEADLFFPLSACPPAYTRGTRLFCVYRGRWEAFEGGVSLHVGVVTSPINAGLAPDNELHGGTVQEDNSETEIRDFAGMLKTDESISEGRRVEWLTIGGVHRIINAECEA